MRNEEPEMNVAALQMVAELATAALAMRDALRSRSGVNWGPEARAVDRILESMGYGPEATASDDDGIVPSMN